MATKTVIRHTEITEGLLLAHRGRGDVVVLQAPPTATSRVHVDAPSPLTESGRTRVWVARQDLAWF